MDTSEKVLVFKSFDSLTQEIIKDSNSTDMLAQRYSVRFIMLNNFNEFQSLAKFMVNIGVDSLDLETLIDDEDKDTWITKDTLKDAIKSTTKSTFVTPFSELVRFYSDEEFRGFLNEIMLLEDIHNPKKRIYLPLIGLQNRFTDFLNHFARIKESAPVWKYDAEKQTVEVYFTKYKNFTIPTSDKQCQLDSLHDWLRFWKVQAPQERLVCTSRPIAAKYKHSKPDNIFTFTHISNAYDFMTEFLDLRFPFEYKEEEKALWETFLTKIDNTKIQSFTFDSFIRAYFNKVHMDGTDVVIEWADENRTAFDRWLLKNYYLHTSAAQEYPYLTLCLETTSDLTDNYQLTNLVATRIVYETSSQKRTNYAKERRLILNNSRFDFAEHVTSEDQNRLYDIIKHIYTQQGDLNAALDLCTGVFDFEKLLLMGWYVLNPKNPRLSHIVREFYPEFEAYQSFVEPSHKTSDNYWSLEYFAAYRNAKLQDTYTDTIAEYIKTKNASEETFFKWYYGFNNTHDVLGEISANPVYHPEKIYWIDGLGAEFLPYILYLINNENSNLKIVRSEITRSKLPSSTKHNRFDGDNVYKYAELDELGHNSHGYKYFTTLRDELNILKRIVHEIINTNKKEKCTIAIVSDHGLSCLSRKAPSKKYDGKFEHEGRYIKATDMAHPDADYIVYTNEDEGQKYRVALTHSSLSKVPTHQVHGGCTPEEVLVPFILLSNKDVTSNVADYQIKVQPEIMLSEPTVYLTIIPEPKSAKLTFNNKVYDLEQDGVQWKTQLKDITEGTHHILVQPEGANAKKVEIKVIGVGLSSDINELFDL